VRRIDRPAKRGLSRLLIDHQRTSCLEPGCALRQNVGVLPDAAVLVIERSDRFVVVKRREGQAVELTPPVVLAEGLRALFAVAVAVRGDEV